MGRLGRYRATIIATAVSAGVFLVFFLGNFWPLPISLVLSLGTYAGLNLVLKPAEKGVLRIHQDPDLVKLLAEAQADLQMLDRISKADDDVIGIEAQKLFDIGESIIDHLDKYPQKIPLARRFLTYYLDTAANLLEKYENMVASRLTGAEVEHITLQTERAMRILNEAFQKQFTHLMANEIMDIENDIKVLEQTLKLEG